MRRASPPDRAGSPRRDDFDSCLYVFVCLFLICFEWVCQDF